MQFSIIIPAKNEEANIGRCLDSIAKVDWDSSQYEVIVVDNGSHDNTVEIAGEKGAKVFVKPELTISGLRNFGAESASGEILAFLDADCTVVPSWLENVSLYLMQKDVACFGSPPLVPENATWVQQAWFAVRKKKAGTSEADWLESMNMFIHRENFVAIGGFNEELVTCEDYDLSLRLKLSGKIVSDERIIAVHHGEAATIGQFFRKEYWRGTSNFQGIIHHGISLKELPSAVLPLCYIIIGVLVVIALITGFVTMNDRLVFGGVELILVWQTPLLFMAAWKNRDPFLLLRALQLYLLLNVYFLARGAAVLKRR